MRTNDRITIALGTAILVVWPGLAQSQQAGPTGEKPAEAAPPAAEAPAAPAAEAPAQTEGVEGAQQGGLLKRGFQAVLGAISGTPGSGPEAQEKGGSEEAHRKLNELVRSANMSIEKGRVAEAVKNINDLISLKPYEADYHLALALCLRRDGKYGEALKKYQDVLDLGGPKALISLLKAEAHASENKPEKVFEHLKEAALGGRNIINDVRVLPLLSSYQQDTEFIKLALQLEKVQVSPSRNKDPFTNPFPRIEGGEKKDVAVAEARVSLSPEEQEKLLLEAKRLYERVQFHIKLEDEAKAMKAYGQLREIIEKKDLFTVPKIASELRILIGRLDKLEIDIEGIRLKYYYGQAQEKLKRVKELFADGEYQQVEAVHGEIVKLTEEMQQANARYKPVAEQIAAVSNKWLARAHVRQDFESRKPSIQGIVISDSSKMALLNDRVVRQGEVVDDFRVVKVESNRVTFRYKGEEIPLVFRRY